MKKLFTLVALCGLGVFSLGCEPAADVKVETPAGEVVTEGEKVETETPDGTKITTQGDGAVVETPEGTVVETEGTTTVTPPAEGTEPAPAEPAATEPAPTEDKPAEEKAPE
jgi:hypothetical protein